VDGVSHMATFAYLSQLANHNPSFHNLSRRAPSRVTAIPT
jgi:hypothetical protein